MAPRIRKSQNIDKSIMTSFMRCIEEQIDNGFSPGDVAHVLTFILVLHKIKFKWSTESVLQLYEEYVMRLEELMDEVQEPIAEA